MMEPSWITKKNAKDAEDYQIRALEGNTANLKNLDYLLKHQGEHPASMAELRQERLREEGEIERQPMQKRPGSSN